MKLAHNPSLRNRKVKQFSNYFLYITIFFKKSQWCPNPEQGRTVIDKVFEDLIRVLKEENTTRKQDRTHPYQSPLSPQSPEIEAPFLALDPDK